MKITVTEAVNKLSSPPINYKGGSSATAVRQFIKINPQARAILAGYTFNTGGIVGYANGGAVEIRSLPSGQEYKVVDGKFAGLVPKTQPEPTPVAPPPTPATPAPPPTPTGIKKMQVAPAQTSAGTPLPTPAPTPTTALPALNSTPQKLIKTGSGTWGIQTVDGRVIDTGRKKKSDATKVSDGYATIQASTATPTSELVDTGKTWSVRMSDGTLVDTGKTKKNLASNLVQEMTNIKGATRQDPSPVTPVPAPVDPVTPVTPVTPVDPVTPVTPVTPVAPVGTDLGSQMANMAQFGTVPDAAVVTTENIPFDAATQNIAEGTGQLTGTPTATQTTATSATPVTTPTETEAAKIKEVERVKEGTEAALGQLETQTLELDPRAQVTAEQQAESSVSDLEAAQGEATLIADEAPTRTMQEGEQIVGTGVDQAQVGAAFGTGEVEAASVVDEISTLMKQFEGGNTPPWAAGAMRNASAQMSARGLGASSMAGQALMQAAMEATLPIAQMEAGNKQQIALFKGEQRAKFMQMDFDQAFQAKVINASKVSEIANMNFSADQQIVLENSRLVNTMNMANLSNKQSLILAEASALANLDMANLNNRQQAEVINAQNFLQVDMANFSNSQQVEMFKAQQRIGALFSDQAAGNAAQQFNATSDNQMSQFFDSLQTQVQQFNNSQQNAMEQFNAGQGNAISQFNTQIQNGRDQFNAQNQLVIAQSNAQWRRQIATADTAATNRANEINAQSALAVSQQAYANLWQERSDNFQRAFTTAENAAQRAGQLALQEMQVAGEIKIAEINNNAQAAANIGGWVFDTVFDAVTGS